jgi:hypothetical protein
LKKEAKTFAYWGAAIGAAMIVGVLHPDCLVGGLMVVPSLAMAAFAALEEELSPALMKT